MNTHDKKLLALTIRYLDEVVEERLEDRLQRLESFVESSPFQINESGDIIVEAPPGPRGPRGFKGLDGEQGPKGLDSSPREVAKELRVDESFVRSITGPTGKAGKDGKDADNSDVAARLKRSKVFKESVKGESGLEGPMGPQGPKGVGLDKLEVLSDGTINYRKTDGTIGTAGKIEVPEKYDDQYIQKEIENLKKSIDRARSDLTGQITRAHLSAGGGSSGGGEVRIEFMDDFDRQSMLAVNEPSVVQWDPDQQKFTVGGDGNLDELFNRVQNIEEYLGIDIPPDANTAIGVNPVVLSATDFLVGDGTKVSVPRGNPNDYNYLYSVRLTDPNSNNMVMDTALFTPLESFDLEANHSLYGYNLYLAYMAEADDQTGPVPYYENVNRHIDPTGMRVVFDFAANDVSNIEAWRLMLNDELVEPVYYYEPNKLIIETNTPIFGAKLEMMANMTGMVGNQSFVLNMSGLSFDIDLVSRGISNVLNYMVFDTSTGKNTSVVEYLDSNNLRFESSFDMTGLSVQVWYN